MYSSFRRCARAVNVFVYPLILRRILSGSYKDEFLQSLLNVTENFQQKISSQVEYRKYSTETIEAQTGLRKLWGKIKLSTFSDPKMSNSAADKAQQTTENINPPKNKLFPIETSLSMSWNRSQGQCRKVNKVGPKGKL